MIGKIIKNTLYFIPLPKPRPAGPPRGAGKLFKNRRNPMARYVFVGDIVENTKDIWYGFTRRVPDDGYLFRNKNNDIDGSANKR